MDIGYSNALNKKSLTIVSVGVLLALLCLCINLFTPLGVNTAFASSAYDDALASVSELRLGPTNDYEDVTKTFTSFFDKCDPLYSDSFKAAVADGYWRVVQHISAYGAGGNIRPIYMFELTWSDNAKGEIVFIEPSLNYPYGGIGLVDDSPSNQKTLSVTLPIY